MKKSKYLAISLMAAILLFFIFFINNINEKNENEKFEILMEALKKTSVQCYATEGFFPPNVDYMEKNYGLTVDHKKYVIYYNVFASNIMPDILVFQR